MDIPHVLDTIAKAFNALRENGILYALTLGWVIGIGLTQAIKMTPWYSTNKWVIRALAVPTGAITTFFLWPDHHFTAERLFTAIGVGVSCPWIYTIVTIVIYKFFPSAEKWISSNPSNPGD